MKKAVVILSGGLDSTTLLYHIINEGYKPHVLSFFYGQKHKKELTCAKNICRSLKLEHKIIDISTINSLLQNSALTNENIEIPKEYYTHENQKVTVVPNRNAIMLSIAVGYAVDIKANKIFYAAHSSDRAIYDDCRWEFVNAFNVAMKLANGNQYLSVEAPFIDKSKIDIVKLGIDLAVPFDMTWSCYQGEDLACGECGTCRERLEAFFTNKKNDPLKYKTIPKEYKV